MHRTSMGASTGRTLGCDHKPTGTESVEHIAKAKCSTHIAGAGGCLCTRSRLVCCCRRTLRHKEHQASVVVSTQDCTLGCKVLCVIEIGILCAALHIRPAAVLPGQRGTGRWRGLGCIIHCVAALRGVLLPCSQTSRVNSCKHRSRAAVVSIFTHRLQGHFNNTVIASNQLMVTVERFAMPKPRCDTSWQHERE